MAASRGAGSAVELRSAAARGRAVGASSTETFFAVGLLAACTAPGGSGEELGVGEV